MPRCVARFCQERTRNTSLLVAAAVGCIGPCGVGADLLAHGGAVMADYHKETADERLETMAENLARDIREGRFPQRSAPMMIRPTAPNPTPEVAALMHEREAHAETQAALREFIADLDRANAALVLAKEALAIAETSLLEAEDKFSVLKHFILDGAAYACAEARQKLMNKSGRIVKAALDAINKLDAVK